MYRNNIQEEARLIVVGTLKYGPTDWEEIPMKERYSRYGDLNWQEVKERYPDITLQLPALPFAGGSTKKSDFNQPTQEVEIPQVKPSRQIFLPALPEQEKPEALKPAPVRRWGWLDSLAFFSIGASLVFLALAIYWLIAQICH